MRVVFRCDPALADRCLRPMPARARAAGLAARHAGDGVLATRMALEVRTVKQCPPFVDAMAHGFVIPLPCDIHGRDGVLSWDWDHPPLTVDAHPRSPLSFHVPAQVAGTPFFDRGRSRIVKFNSFWTIELEPGYSLFATHPVNRADLPFRLLTGLVDCDRFSDVGILFPAAGSIRNSKARAARHAGRPMLSRRPRGARTALRGPYVGTSPTLRCDSDVAAERARTLPETVRARRGASRS